MRYFYGILCTLSAILLLTLLTKCTTGGDNPPDPGTEIRVSGVSLPTELALSVGDNATLTATVVPANATNKRVTWSSDPTVVATVDVDGKVAAVGGGIATITARSVDGGYTADCRVTVRATDNFVAVTGVTLDAGEVTLTVGEQIALTASVTPTNATNRNVTWSSGNATVATVDANGKITARRAGNATITVTTEEGGKTATCRAIVGAPDPNNLLNADHIPDPVFLEYCRDRMDEWDTNNDGRLYAGEAATVGAIDVANVYGNAIQSLKGIEYFTGITYLDCSLNNLTSLDVSKNTRLTELYCNNNRQLSSLVISEYTTLTFLNCSSCMLTSLDISKCTRLIELSCFFNDLTSLDTSQCINLNTLDVDGNDLTSLDLTRNRALRGLICSNNRLSSLNLSRCNVLSSLDTDGNEIASLDLSGNEELIFLNCSMNRLTSLDLSENVSLESLLCDGNQLTSIVIGAGNTRLDLVRSSSNSLSADALNELFEALPYSGTIALYNNPGTTTCNISLIQAKNWIVQSN